MGTRLLSLQPQALPYLIAGLGMTILALERLPDGCTNREAPSLCAAHTYMERSIPGFILAQHAISRRVSPSRFPEAPSPPLLSRQPVSLALPPPCLWLPFL